MGQIERYGLYVLVLVIMLILGVAIWGDGSEVAAGPRTPQYAANRKASDLIGSDRRGSGLETPADDPARTRSGAQDSAGRGRTSQPIEDFEHLADLFEPSAQTPPRADPGSRRANPGVDPADEPVGDMRNPGSGPGEPTTQTGGSETWTYEFKRGDNFYTIAKRELGSAARYKEIAQLNSSLDPRRIQTGTVIVMPPRNPGGPSTAGGNSSTVNAAGGDVHVVQVGETIERIARRRYGKELAGKYSLKIQKLNPGVEPGSMLPGTKLQLPPAPTTSN